VSFYEERGGGGAMADKKDEVKRMSDKAKSYFDQGFN
jgi:hypothetical protein